jgi:tripartite-type tricarboxylate transporter receptor subunit TctC
MIKKLATALLATIALGTGYAQAWQPSKPIEAIMAWAPGSVNELTFRVLAEEVEKNTGAKFVVINRGGAGGVIGTEELSKKPADGYAVTVVSVPGIAAMDKVSVPETSAGRTYTTDSFVYPTHLATSPFVVVAHAKDPINNPKAFVRVITNEPVTIAASGGARLVFEQLSVSLKLQQNKEHVVRVDHQGPVQALTDVAGGHVRFAIVPALVANAFYKDGRVQIVAVSGSNTITQMPNVQTLATAVTGFNIPGSWGLMMPKGAPKEVVDWYTAEFTRAMKSESVKKVWADNLLEFNPNLQNATAFESRVKQREKEWQPLVDTVVKQINKK